MKKLHYAPSYFLDPRHPITVNLIGVGGTGSQVLTSLARIHQTLVALDHPGLFVNVFDPDTVSPTNIGRQLFSPLEISLNKANVLVTRVNHFFGLNWQSHPVYFKYKKNDQYEYNSNILITCTDNIKSRVDIWNEVPDRSSASYIDHRTSLYWMDFGNSQKSGQVILGTINKDIKQPKSKKYETIQYLPVATEMFDYSQIKDKDSGPSCSLAEALQKQDLFINSTLAQIGSALIWKLISTGSIDYRGAFLNLDTMKVNPIKL